MFIGHLGGEWTQLLNEFFPHLMQLSMRYVDTAHPKHGPEFLHLLLVPSYVFSARPPGHARQDLFSCVILLIPSVCIPLALVVSFHPSKNGLGLFHDRLRVIFIFLAHRFL
jgi:hypothetical protein